MAPQQLITTSAQVFTIYRGKCTFAMSSYSDFVWYIYYETDFADL